MVSADIGEASIFPSSEKEANEVPNEFIPEIRKQADILKPDKVPDIKDRKKGWFSFKTDIKWLHIIVLTLLHAVTLYYSLTLPWIKSWRTVIFNSTYAILTAFGVTGGAHRLWTHRAYKAKTPLRIILMLCYVAAGQNSIYQWVRDHRIHHKYSETNADPHNSNRGLFFSHVGWLMLKKHTEVIKKGRQVDMSDIEADPVVTFSNKYLIPLRIILCFIIPTIVPVYFWNEDWRISFCFRIIAYVFALNATWSVNSFAHLYGTKPYNKNIAPVENKIVGYVTFGEGWHNYHHTFPWDYRAAEIGGWRYNLTANLIDMFAKIGWAYDLKMPSESLVKMTITKRGDGTHKE